MKQTDTSRIMIDLLNEIEYKINEELISKFLSELKGAKQNAAVLFARMNPEERRVSVNTGIPIHSYIESVLYRALQVGYPLQFIEMLVSANSNPAILQDPHKIFMSIFSNKRAGNHKFEKIHVAYFLKFFTARPTGFDPRPSLISAMEQGEEEAGLMYLESCSKMITRGFAQQLLDACCQERIKFTTIKKLLSMGAVLQTKHTKIFASGLEKKTKYTSADMLNILDLFKKSQIKIPLFAEYFTNVGEINLKRFIVTHQLTQCNDEDWESIETIFKNFQASDVHLNYEERVNLDLISTVFINNPLRKLSQPEEMVYFAKVAIKSNHNLIHILLDRGLNLYHHVSYNGGHINFPSHTYKITLADMVGFYSSDLKLLTQLKTINNINIFGRTNAHYAALSMSIKEKFPKSTNINSLSNQIRNYPHLQNFIAANHYYINFNLVGSEDAFYHSNFNTHWDTGDILNFTPLNYANMNIDLEKFKRILNNFYFSLSINLKSALFLPGIILNIIKEYAFFPSNPDSLVIAWAEKLISLENYFEEAFKSEIIFPLKNFILNGKYIHNHASMFTARTIMQCFNKMTVLDDLSVSRFNFLNFNHISTRMAMINPVRQVQMGYNFLIGRGVEKDSAKALTLFKLAARQGYEGGVIQLARCYQHGVGVQKNLDHAIYLYKMAAGRGSICAQNELNSLNPPNLDMDLPPPLEVPEYVSHKRKQPEPPTEIKPPLPLLPAVIKPEIPVISERKSHPTAPTLLHPILIDEWKIYIEAIRRTPLGNLSQTKTNCDILAATLAKGTETGDFLRPPKKTKKNAYKFDTEFVEREFKDGKGALVKYLAVQNIFTPYAHDPIPGCVNQFLELPSRTYVDLETLQTQTILEGDFEGHQPKVVAKNILASELREFAAQNGGWALVSLGFSCIRAFSTSTDLLTAQHILSELLGHLICAYVVTSEFNASHQNLLSPDHLITYIDPQALTVNQQRAYISHTLDDLISTVKDGQENSHVNTFDNHITMHLLNSHRQMSKKIPLVALPLKTEVPDSPMVQSPRSSALFRLNSSSSSSAKPVEESKNSLT